MSKAKGAGAARDWASLPQRSGRTEALIQFMNWRVACHLETSPHVPLNEVLIFSTPEQAQRWRDGLFVEAGKVARIVDIGGKTL